MACGGTGNEKLSHFQHQKTTVWTDADINTQNVTAIISEFRHYVTNQSYLHSHTMDCIQSIYLCGRLSWLWLYVLIAFIPLLRVLKSSVPVYHKIWFRIANVPGFPKNKNMMFLTKCTNILTFPEWESSYKVLLETLIYPQLIKKTQNPARRVPCQWGVAWHILRLWMETASWHKGSC
jgi:hypothetical protein